MKKSTLWARKPVDQYDQEMKKSGLRRCLGKWQLTAMGIGSVIGAGIFVMTGLAAREYAGPALWISFILSGTGCAFAALCYAEFASLIPVEGSAYAYSYATIGELFAWIIGWDLILEYAMSSASVAVGWSAYFTELMASFNLKLPLWLMHDHVTATRIITEATGQNTFADLALRYSSTGFPTIAGFELCFNMPAFLITLITTLILVWGIKETANSNLIMVLIKLAIILFIIIVGATMIQLSNFDPMIPPRETAPEGHGRYGWMGVLSGAAYVFFAYIGFDAVSTQAGEARRPQKDVPFGIIVSLIISTILYIGVAIVLTGMVNYRNININAPLTVAFSSNHMNWAGIIISIAAIAGLTSVLLVTLLGQTRIFYAMAKDGLLPNKTFASLHSRFRTPYRGTMMTGFLVAMVAALTPIDDIALLVNIGTLLAFILVCIAVWVMRVKEPHLKRPFRTPYLPFVATMGILINLGMITGLGWINWLRLMVWLLAGLIIYFLYSRHHSKLKEIQ